MTKLSDTNTLLEKLPPENRAAVVGLIELKVEGDMKEVLYQLKLMDLKIEAMDSKFEAKFQTLFWAVGLIAAAIIAIATKLLFM
jgi:hypothetical protein